MGLSPKVPVRVYLIAIAMIAVALAVPVFVVEAGHDGSWRIGVWAIEAVALIYLISQWPKTEQGVSIFVDEEGLLNTSRVLTGAWFVIVMSAYLTVALWNVAIVWTVENPNPSDLGPLDISIPQEVWLLAGVTTTALVGEPLAKLPARLKATTHSTAPDGFQFKGVLLVRSRASDAIWGDLFRGRFEGATETVDFTRIQVFFVNMVVFVAYAVALAGVMGKTAAQDLIGSFPALSDGAVTLSLISSAGFLGMTAIDARKDRPSSGE